MHQERRDSELAPASVHALDTTGIELPTLRTPVLVGDSVDEDAIPLQKGLPLEPPPVIEVPVHVREGPGRRSGRRRGRKPARREMAAKVGGGNRQRNAWCQALEREAHQTSPDKEAVARVSGCPPARDAGVRGWGADLP